MNRYRELAVRLLRTLPSVSELSEPLPDSAIDAFAFVIKRRFGAPLIPNVEGTIACAPNATKTAALFFDRVWWSPVLPSSVPKELIVYGATDEEIWSTVACLAVDPPYGDNWEKVKSVFGVDSPLADMWARQDEPPARVICEAMFREHGIQAIPIYEAMGSFEKDYQCGSSEALVAVLQGLDVVEERSLEWDQVLDFRSDQAAKTKLRRLRHWLDITMVGKPLSYVRDELAVRLEDYEWALKKHGIKTVIGTVAEILDPRFFASVAAASAGLAFAGAEFWAAVGAAGALAGRVALSVTTRLLDLKEIARGSEVAAIHEVKQLGTGAKPKTARTSISER